MTLLKWLLGVVVLCGGFVAVMYVAQRSLQYFPDKARLPPAAANLSQAEEIVLDTPDGEQIIVWHVPPRFPYTALPPSCNSEPPAPPDRSGA